MSQEDLSLVEQVLNRLLTKELEADAQTPASELLSNLLAEVHVMRESKARNLNSDELFQHADDSNATVAAVKAAVAAAHAAQAAADSVAKNSQLVEMVLETARRKQPDEDKLTDDTSEQDVVKLVKRVQKQNVVTQLILGFMVVATAFWRYKEISLILRLKKMMSNPLETVGGMLGGGNHHQHHHHHKHEETETKPLQLPHLELPTLFQQKTETEEKSTTTTS